MVQDETAQTVETAVGVSLPKKVIDEYRQRSSNQLAEYSDTEIVKALAGDILNRYFNEEYLDIDSLVE